MAIYNWASLGDGTVFGGGGANPPSFDPLVDQLIFDDAGISAAAVFFQFVSGTSSTFSYGGKTVTLNAAPETLTTTNITFADGSVLIVGDNDTLTGADGGANTLTGGAGDDQLFGLGGDDSVVGLDGNDRLDGGPGADTLAGGPGDDTYVVSDAGDFVTEGASAGVDTVLAGITYSLGTNLENLTLTGVDSISGAGNGLDNVLVGNTGNNVLNGLAGADTMVGGIGSDTYFVDNAGDVVTENDSEGADAVQASVTHTLAAHVENLTLTGVAAIDGTGNSLANVLTGNLGGNVLDGAGGADTLVGGLGNDTYIVDEAGDVVTEGVSAGTDAVQASVTFTLAVNVEDLTLTGLGAINGTGNAAPNVLIGNSGNNVLDGLAGADTLVGGLGDDTYVVDEVDDLVGENASEGTDTVQAVFTYTLGTDLENVTLTGLAAINGTGNAAPNILIGNAGNNVLDGLAGADTLAGGGGDDTYVVDNAGDVVTEGVSAGVDTVLAGITYILGANLENLTLTGVDSIGGAGNGLDNTLVGNTGDNVLNGLAGADTMVGGIGSDTYFVDNAGDVVTENASEGADAVQASATHTLAANVENLTLTGVAAIDGTGNSLANVLTGNSGANVLDGAGGADTLAGGLGNDTYVVDSVLDMIVENAAEGIDTVQVGYGYLLGATLDNLALTGDGDINGTGNELANALTGNAGNNFLDGVAANDTLDGGAGTDTLIGGAGNDTYIVDALDTWMESPDEGTDTLVTGFSHALEADFENLTLTGTGDFSATGNASGNVLTGNSGNNTFSGGEGNDTISGGAGNDTAEYAGLLADYTLASAGSGTVRVTDLQPVGGNDGVDVVTVETLLFADATVQVSTVGNQEVRVNTATASDQGAPSVAALSGGGYVVVWQSNVQDGSGYGIYGQRYDSAGAASGSEFRVNTWTVNDQINPSVTGLSGGGFVVTWQSNGQDGSGYGIYAQRYDAAGNAAGIEFRVNQFTSSNQANVSVAAQSGGGFLVAWQTTGQVSGDDIYIRRYDGGGIPLNSETLLNANAGGNGQTNPAITALTNGNLVVAFQTSFVFSGSTDIAVRLINSGGSPIGSDILVNGTFTQLEQTNPSVAALTGGGFVVAWQSNYPYSQPSNDIAIRRFDGNGNVVSSSDLLVNSAFTPNEQVNPTVTGLANGGFVVTWQSQNQDGSGYAIYGQRYDGSSNPASVGGMFRVNTTVASDQTVPAVTALADGGFVVTWQSSGQDGSGAGIYSQRYDAGGNAFQSLALNVTGDASDQVFAGSQDNDTLAGGGGHDFYTVNSAADMVVENVGEGEDTVSSSAGTYTLSANVEDLVLTGTGAINGAGNADGNVITGNSGNNVLDGGGGNDTLAGGAGSDTYVVDDASDLVTENSGEGSDTVQSFAATYTLPDNVENLTLAGVGNINGTGNSLPNNMTGNAGNNVLVGGTGNDTITGGLGADTAQFPDGISGYSITGILQNSAAVTGTEGDDFIAGVESLQFADATVQLNFSGMSEFRANTYTSNEQTTPAVAALAGGGFVTVWQSFVQDGSNYGIYGQRYDRSGSPAGPEFLVNAFTSDHQTNASIAGLANGGFVVLWQSNGQDGSGYGIYGRVYDSAGLAVSPEFRANSYTAADQTNASIAPLLDGGFVVTWQTAVHPSDSGAGIYGQRYNATGVVVGGEFHVNTYVPDTQDTPAVAGLLDGGFVAVWQSRVQDGSGYGIYAQRYSQAGSTAGAEFRVSTTTFADQAAPSITALPDGGFVVVWHSQLQAQDPGGFSVYGQRYNSAAAAVGVEFRVNTTIASEQLNPAVAALTSGGFIVVWQSLNQDGNGYGIYGQRYDAAGNAAGSEFRVNTFTVGEQTACAVTALPVGGFVVTWQSQNQDGSGHGIYSQIYDESGNPAGLLTLFATGDAGDQSLSGGTGHDTLDGGGGADTLAGGAGNDTYAVDSALDVVTENPGEGTDLVQSSAAAFALPANVENLALTGAANIAGTGNTQSNLITGNSGDNTIAGGGGNDTAVGGGGTDTAVFAGVASGYSLSQSATGIPVVTDTQPGVSGNDGTDVLSGVELLQFADAQVQFGGATGSNEFRANVFFTNSEQNTPAVAGLAGGGIVSAWQALQDGSSYGIYAQRFDAFGNTAGGEFRANTTTANDQSGVAVAALADGGFVMTWSSQFQDGSGYGIYGQRYTSTGGAAGSEFRVNTFVTNDQSSPSVAALAGGGFVVSWHSNSQDGNSYGIYAQRFDSAGNPLGSEFKANTFINFEQVNSSIAGLANGGFVIAWQSNFQFAPGYDIYFQRYNSAGSAVGGESRASTFFNGDQSLPAVAALSDGGFVVVWQSAGQDASGTGVYGQRYNSSGVAVGPEFRANTYIPLDQLSAAVAGLSGGGFVVAWQSNGQDGSANGIYAQRYDAAGAAVGSEFRVNTVTAGEQSLPSITALAGGGFLVTWHSSDGAGNGIFGQAYDASGIPTGTLNLSATGDSSSQSLAGGAGNDTLDGGAGADTLTGGAGNDTYLADSPPDVVVEGGSQGTDLVLSAAASYTLSANVENLVLTSTAGSAGTGNGAGNVITGNTGNDTLDGGGGADTLVGGAGDDTYVYDGSDTVLEVALEGADTVQVDFTYTLAIGNIENVTLAGAGNINASGDGLANTLSGNSGDNLVSGLGGGDSLAGGGGADTLAGGTGNDTLTGGAGNDSLVGGAGDDTAVFAGAIDGYSFTQDAVGKLLVADIAPGTAGDEGVDRLIGVRYLQFADTDVEWSYQPDGERQVNAFLTFDQTAPSVAALAGGGYVISWESDTLDGSGAGVFARRYDGAGNAAATDFLVNNYTSGDQANPAVAALAGSGFVVAWQSAGQDGDASGIYARRYDGSGIPAGVEFPVNLYTTSEQANPAVTGLAGGGFVVSWQSLGQDGTGYGAYARIFDGSGNALTADIRTNTFTGTDQANTAITALADGGFLVMWQSEFQDGSENGIYAQRYGPVGNPVGAEFRVNSFVGFDQSAPAIASLQDGGFIVAWQSEIQDGDGYGIYAQRYTAAGALAGPEFRANLATTAGDQLMPSVTSLADGGFVITWQSADDSGSGIYGQRYDSGGSLAGGQFRINTSMAEDQVASSVAGLPDGGFVVTWQSTSKSGFFAPSFDRNIYQQVFDGAGSPVGTVNLTVIGTGANEHLIGGAGDDTIDGGGGTDTLQGGAGSDTYFVDSADDLIVESGTLPGGLVLPGGGGGSFKPGLLGSVIDGFTDTVIAAINYSLSNLAFVENLQLAGLATEATGNELANTLGANTIGSLLQGLGGNDSLEGGTGDDTLDGGTESDYADYRAATAGIAVYLATGSASGAASGADVLVDVENVLGTPYDDVLSGNDLDNLLDGGAGADTLMGGMGDDTYVIDALDTLLAEQPGEGIDTVIASFQFSLPENFEVLVIKGTGQFSIEGNSAANRLAGGVNSDLISGGEGDDTLEGGEGNDTLDGGAGANTVSYSTAAAGVMVDLGAGTVADGAGGIDVLLGIRNAEGSSFSDSLTGDGGGNVLLGSGGADTLAGGKGIDTLVGGDGGDIHILSATPTSGASRIVFVQDTVAESGLGGGDAVLSSSSYVLPDGVEDLVLTGAPMWRAYTGTGNDLGNVLEGQGAARHRLSGEGGDDTLIGGGGADTLSGGSGSDVFLFNTTPDADTILDFTSGTDHLNLDDAIFSELTPGAVDAQNVQVAGATSIDATSGDADDYLKYATDTGHLYYDSNGSAAGGLSLIATVYSSGTAPATLLPAQDILIV